MSLDQETAEQPHHVMIVFGRWIADTEYPVKQVGVGAIEQRLEPSELIAVQAFEGVLGERAEDEVALLRPAMPASKQEAPAADIRMFVNCSLRSSLFHKPFFAVLVENRRCYAFVTFVDFISSTGVITTPSRARIPRAGQRWILTLTLLL
jgi:hypothetical protein